MPESLYSAQTACIDTLRIADKQWVEAVQELERQGDFFRGSDKRVDERVDYRVTSGILVQITHPGGSRANYLVRPRNLSRTGMGFLHGRFLHPGSTCGLVLKGLNRESHLVPAKVVWCKYVQSGIHEVGVRFAEPITLESFICNVVPAGAHEEQSTALPRLHGQVLHIDDSPDDRELLRYMMNKLGLETHSASDAAEGLALLQRTPGAVNLIVVDYWLAGTTGAELARSIRSGGFTGPIIALTADEQDQVRQDVLGAGCNDLLVKPYTLDGLAAVLAKHLPERSDGGPGDVLMSSFWDNPKMRPLIVAFLSRLGEHADQIRKLANSPGQEEALKKMCLEIKGAAGGYGYPSISQAAQEYRQALGQSAPESIHRHQQTLLALCAAACKAAK